MKSKYIVFALSILTSFTITACGHEHQFIEATCTTPKTCTECQETEGEALGHTFTEATCTTPRTCSVCNLTEGNPLEHTWLEATTESPKTCEACGLTDGEPLILADDEGLYIESENTAKLEESSGEADIQMNVADIDPVVAQLDKDLASGKISQETYDYILGTLTEGKELADENGNYSLNEASDQYHDKNNTESKSQPKAEEPIRSSYQPDYNTEQNDEAFGADYVPFGQGDYSGLEHYRTN